MKLSTLDIESISKCPKRWHLITRVPNNLSTIQKFLKKTVLLKALGKDSRWTSKGIAKIWDEVFWEGKDYTKETADQSIRGTLAARKIFKHLPELYEAYSCQILELPIESNIILSSSGDFFIVTKDRFEIWIYGKSSIVETKRSILPSAERALLEQKVSAAKLKGKRIFIVRYYVGKNAIMPTLFRIECPENFRAVRALASLAEKKILFPVKSLFCEECEVPC